MRVTGVGGFFLRSPDPAALAEWYSRALGMEFAAAGATWAVFTDDVPGSISVFSVFDAADTYIGEPGRQGAMVNLRVDDLDEVRSHLTSLGEVAEPVLEEDTGRFSWTVDPDGNRVELWEPPAVPRD